MLLLLLLIGQLMSAFRMSPHHFLSTDFVALVLAIFFSFYDVDSLYLQYNKLLLLLSVISVGLGVFIGRSAWSSENSLLE
jgi:hypothetical protein